MYYYVLYVFLHLSLFFCYDIELYFGPTALHYIINNINKETVGLTLDVSLIQYRFLFRTRHPYIQGVYDVSELIVQRIMNPLHHYGFIYKFTNAG